MIATAVPRAGGRRTQVGDYDDPWPGQHGLGRGRDPVTPAVGSGARRRLPVLQPSQ